jgi:hypothetical protein
MKHINHEGMTMICHLHEDNRMSIAVLATPIYTLAKILFVIMVVRMAYITHIPALSLFLALAILYVMYEANKI